MQNKKEQTQKIIKEMQKKQSKEEQNKTGNTTIKTIEKMKQDNGKIKNEETYEFEYDETLEDE